MKSFAPVAGLNVSITADVGFSTNLYALALNVNTLTAEVNSTVANALPENAPLFTVNLLPSIKTMPDFLADQPAIYSRLSSEGPLQNQLKSWLQKVRGMSRSGASTPNRIEDVEAMIHEMRLFKDTHEINIMRASGKIAADGHIRFNQFTRN